MITVDNKDKFLEKEYEELILEIKKDLPNIVLPSMGVLDEVSHIDIKSKDFIVSSNEEV